MTVNTLTLMLIVLIYVLLAGLPPTVYEHASVPMITVLLPVQGREGLLAGICCNSTGCAPVGEDYNGYWDPTHVGLVTVDPDLWGLTSNGAGAEGCSLAKYEGGILAFTDNLTLYQAPADDTIGYHEVIYGAKPWNGTGPVSPFLPLPLNCGELPEIILGLGYTLLAGEPGIDIAIDSWLLASPDTTRAPASGDYEVMIVFYMEGGEPAGSEQGPVATYTLPIIVNGSLVLEEFELYKTVRSGGWIFYTFRSGHDYANATILVDYTMFIKELERVDANICPGHYLSSIELGVEVFTSNCTGYPCDVNVLWKLNRYYIIIKYNE